MTKPLEPHGITAECLHCGREFEPRKYGHVFCSTFCRHHGERQPHEREPIDLEAIERLFDESRDPGEPCREDDWFPESCAEMKALYMYDTVEGRRRWYGNLLLAGKL
jgi:hypothetical protein